MNVPRSEGTLAGWETPPPGAAPQAPGGEQPDGEDAAGAGNTRRRADFAERPGPVRRDVLSDRRYQRQILPGVSRTFALTIPQLPRQLIEVVGNGYLLCRIADTIEDEPSLAVAEKRRFCELFVEAVAGRGSPQRFAEELAPRLSARTSEAERNLVRNTPRVLRLTRGFDAPKRAALERCVRVMCEGMLRFQERKNPLGLEDLAELDLYCYYVAGVVGEMLTELFCDYSPRVAERRASLMELAAPFGKGLQFTNILKDIWEDRERGACWLPRALFEARGCDLGRLADQWGTPACGEGLATLLAAARGYLKQGLEYTLLIPAKEEGIRTFCLWALGMAVLTLGKVNRNRGFRSGNEVKISRRSVRGTIAVTAVARHSNLLLRALFAALARGLPAEREA